MKISYNWLKNYIDTDLSAQQIAELLTDCGLEVESVEKHETIKGGLQGIVVGEVKTKEKHPDADRLSVTTVDVGTGILQIVCGAANVAAGQKVAVAMDGATLYPTKGEPFQIKKSKIRGQASEGMICAEDEIGLGMSHDGIMVLEADAKIGTPAKDYFKIEEDYILEIGLTPNRADAASHIGVARDLVATISCRNENKVSLKMPDVRAFEVDNTNSKIEVVVEDKVACPRYSGVVLTGITVKESPAWLKNKLLAIGLRPINNIVDITNYVLHELGQPLHAFDYDKISGQKVVVKKVADITKFKTLDGVERELSANDLMICNASEPMCIAGVFGGEKSGVTEQTKTIFLESAYFNSVSIRKTSKHHGLKTDASFRYERGADPNITVYALKRAAMLMKEIAGGEITSEIIDIYSSPVENFKIGFSYSNCDKIVGKEIERGTIKSILKSLGIEIINEGNDGLMLSVPPFKVDVQREIDVIEEVLRVYGYNNIELPKSLRASLSFSSKPDKEKAQNIVSDLLVNNEFSEIMSTSLTKEEYTDKNFPEQKNAAVKMLNPLSSDLNVLRQTLLFSGLEAVAYNQNRKNNDLKLFEFGKTYNVFDGEKYVEENHLSLFMCGRKNEESWNAEKENVGFFQLKGIVTNCLTRLGIQISKQEELSDTIIGQGLTVYSNKRQVAKIGLVKKTVAKQFDISSDVYYADINWDTIISLLNTKDAFYKEVSKFPSVRRDLALLLDKKIKFSEVEQIAFQSEKNLLKNINLFDVYEGDKLEQGKKSYAVSFTLQDETATLTDKQIEKVMEKLSKNFSEKLGAVIRDK